jgi:hypothetical protein
MRIRSNQLNKYLCAGVIAFALVASPAEAACEEDTVYDVSGDGAVITMLSGSVFQVDAADQIDTQLWSTSDDVLVCDDAEIINKDESGERVSVNRLH